MMDTPNDTTINDTFEMDYANGAYVGIAYHVARRIHTLKTDLDTARKAIRFVDNDTLVAQIRKVNNLLDEATRNVPCDGPDDGYAMLCDRCTSHIRLNHEWEVLKRMIEPEGVKVLSPLLEHCKKSAERVKKWPKWKQNILREPRYQCGDQHE